METHERCPVRHSAGCSCRGEFLNSPLTSSATAHTTISVLVTAAVNPEAAGDAVTKLNDACHKAATTTLRKADRLVTRQVEECGQMPARPADGKQHC